MTEYHHESNHQYGRERKMNRSGEYNHSNAECPDYGESNQWKFYIKEPGEVNNGEFQHDEPESALEKKCAEFFFSFSATDEKSGSPCEEYKHWCAKMCHPSRGKQCWVSFTQIQWIEQEC